MANHEKFRSLLSLFFHGTQTKAVILMVCEITKKITFRSISGLFNDGKYLSWYIHGEQKKSSVHHEFHKCSFHCHENKDNQFFMAISRLFNKSWFHSA